MKKQSNNIEFKTAEGKLYDIPEEGSLGLLALGHVGLMAWRSSVNQSKSPQSAVHDNEPLKSKCQSLNVEFLNF